MRVVRLVYEDGSTVELEQESHELINEISRLSAIWSVAAYDGDAATLLKYSPRWCEICGKVLSFWPGWNFADADGNLPDTLSCFGIYNVKMGYGFFAY